MSEFYKLNTTGVSPLVFEIDNQIHNLLFWNFNDVKKGLKSPVYNKDSEFSGTIVYENSGYILNIPGFCTGHIRSVDLLNVMSGSQGKGKIIVDKKQRNRGQTTLMVI